MIFLSIFIITLVLVVIGFYFVRNYAFKNIILGKRKSKEDAFNILTKRNVYDIKEYDNLNFEDLYIKSLDGYKLKGYFLNNFENSKKLIIIVHGYTANHFIGLQFMDMFLKEKFNVLLIDTRSHGESEGKNVTYGLREREDLHLWVNFMKKKLGNNLTIGLHGESMGAATVLMYGGKYDDVDFIIEDCGYSNGKELLRYQFKKTAKFPLYPLYFLVNNLIKRKCNFSMNDVSPIDDIKNKEIPTLFIHGTGDKLIPYTMSEEMFNCKIGNKNKLFLVENAAHVEAYAKDKEGYEKVVREFINSIKQ